MSGRQRAHYASARWRRPHDLSSPRHLGWHGPDSPAGPCTIRRANPWTIDAMLFDCAICFAVASLMLVGAFGLLAVPRIEAFLTRHAPRPSGLIGAPQATARGDAPLSHASLPLLPRGSETPARTIVQSPAEPVPIAQHVGSPGAHQRPQSAKATPSGSGTVPAVSLSQPPVPRDSETPPLAAGPSAATARAAPIPWDTSSRCAGTA